MDNKLIQELWEHTYATDQKVSKKIQGLLSKSGLSDAEKRQIDPRHLSGKFFLDDAASDVFISFHQEKSNSNVHDHDFFELLYVVKGSPIGVIDSQEIFLTEGNLCIMNPNAVHYFKKYHEGHDLILNIVLPQEIFHKSIFHMLFNDSALNSFFIRYQIENASKSYLLFTELDQDIETFIRLLINEILNKKQYSRVIIDHLLTLLFTHIIRESEPKQRSSVLSQIIDTIYTDYQTVSLNRLSSKYNYHPKYLSARIHDYTGHSFRQLLTHIRLQNVVNYLLYTDDTIEHIVEQVGYKDKSSLYAAFKKKYHMSPSQYRKLHQLP